MQFRSRRSNSRPRAWFEFLESRQLLSAVSSRPIPLTPRQSRIAAILTTYFAANAQSTPFPFTSLPASPTSAPNVAHTTLAFGPTVGGVLPHSTSPPGSAYTPAQMRAAYGFNSITFGSVLGDGSGQTIAIVDAYDDPNALADLQTFDQQFGLPDPPSFERVNQTGQTSNYPSTDPAGPASQTHNNTWEEEESLDVQWAHAIAPGASIILVETNSDGWNDLIQGGVAWARSQPQVSVISMSWGGAESILKSTELTYDTYFTTPAGHESITFVASTGDNASPGSYPAYSPNVVAVGGTTLNIVNNAWSSETGWSDSGGGISLYEPQPSFQTGVVTQSTTKRTEPDVAMDADPNTGVAIVDSWDYSSSPWLTIGGTSLAAPMVAATIAIADQGRELVGKGTLDGSSQTLPMLYSIASSDYHDIISGNNGYSAGAGYDLVTGRGTPFANAFVGDLVGVISSISGTVFQDSNLDGVLDPGDAPIPGATVYLDANNNGTLDGPLSQNQSSGSLNSVVPARGSSTLTLTTAGLATTVTTVTVSLSISDTRDSSLSAYLIAPDGTQITLFSGVGGFGTNFTSTTFNDAATASIFTGSAPFTGTFTPQNPLATFAGHAASGNWSLKVSNSSFGRNGTTATVTGWSISVTTAAEISTLSASDGTFSFPDIPSGNYNVREITPAGFSAESTNGFGVSVLGAASVNFPNTAIALVAPPAILTTTAEYPVLYIGADPSDGALVDISTNADGSNPEFQAPLASLSALTFNLYVPGSTLILDYSNGSPVPAGGLTIDGGGITGNQLTINGGENTFSLDDYTLASGTGTVNYQNLSVIKLTNGTYTYTGSFSTVDNFIISTGALVRLVLV